jgi:predicted SAM-dependent methyltransferase
MSELKRYNFGCGNLKLKGYVNIDIDESLEPDLIVNLIDPPFVNVESNSASQILFIHTIEHIDKKFHFNILIEFQRILHETGTIYIAFPEFEKIVKNWLVNYQGKRDYWEATVYGRGLSEHDRHVTAMRSIEVQELMLECGFKNVKITPEPGADYNTLISANKGVRLPTYEEHIIEKTYGTIERAEDILLKQK